MMESIRGSDASPATKRGAEKAFASYEKTFAGGLPSAEPAPEEPSQAAPRRGWLMSQAPREGRQACAGKRRSLEGVTQSVCDVSMF